MLASGSIYGNLSDLFEKARELFVGILHAGSTAASQGDCQGIRWVARHSDRFNAKEVQVFDAAVVCLNLNKYRLKGAADFRLSRHTAHYITAEASL